MKRTEPCHTHLFRVFRGSISVPGNVCDATSLPGARTRVICSQNLIATRRQSTTDCTSRSRYGRVLRTTAAGEDRAPKPPCRVAQIAGRTGRDRQHQETCMQKILPRSCPAEGYRSFPPPMVRVSRGCHKLRVLSRRLSAVIIVSTSRFGSADSDNVGRSGPCQPVPRWPPYPLSFRRTNSDVRRNDAASPRPDRPCCLYLAFTTRSDPPCSPHGLMKYTAGKSPSPIRFPRYVPTIFPEAS
jgi:hypothetical protein